MRFWGGGDCGGNHDGENLRFLFRREVEGENVCKHLLLLWCDLLIGIIIVPICVAVRALVLERSSKERYIQREGNGRGEREREREREGGREGEGE